MPEGQGQKHGTTTRLVDRGASVDRHPRPSPPAGYLSAAAAVRRGSKQSQRPRPVHRRPAICPPSGTLPAAQAAAAVGAGGNSSRTDSPDQLPSRPSSVRRPTISRRPNSSREARGGGNRDQCLTESKSPHPLTVQHQLRGRR